MHTEIKTWLTDSLTEWVSKWQGHLLSCPGQLKIISLSFYSQKSFTVDLESVLEIASGGIFCELIGQNIVTKQSRRRRHIYNNIML